MTVYVDEAIHKFRGMVMCHMIADSIEELHEMADKIGVDRKHYQGTPSGSRPHYDICKTKRTEAVRLGAQQVTSREIVKILKNLNLR